MKEFFKNFWRLTRPLSSVKNVALVLVAFYFSGEQLDLAKIIFGTIFLSLACSAVYAYNTLNDRKIDRENKNKEHYSKAAEYFGTKRGDFIVFLLVTIGFIGGLVFDVYFSIVLLLILLNGFLYSSKYTRFKEKPVLDVFFGAFTPFLLRFTAAWLIFKVSFPPLLPLIFLVCTKSGGYLLYKELDRPYLEKLGIKNSVTIFKHKTKIIISVAFFTIAFFSFIYSCLLGQMPLRFLFLLILAVPPLFIIYLMSILKIDTKVNEFRVMGYYYWIVVIIFILFII